MKITPRQGLNFFLLLSILEGLVVTAVLLSIPADPKNAFFLGYSKSRLLILFITLGLLVGLCFSLFHKKAHKKISTAAFSSPFLRGLMPWVGGVAALLLYVTLWLPPYRLTTLAAGFVRLQPLLIWLELLVLQLALLVWLLHHVPAGNWNAGDVRSNTRWLIGGIGLFILTALVFLLLSFFSNEFPGQQLYFPPGAPISGLQVLITWFAFFLLYKIQVKFGGKETKRKVLVGLVFIVIWAVTFLIWNSTPVVCTDDRPGPFPPNQVCYPTINDAVYSIGSHYISLGQGIYNHWMTDKPLYMAFLALGQLVAGRAIDDYLAFQVGVVALIPALLFLAVRKKYGSALGGFIAVLAIFQGTYAISLYREVGSVNVKLENPEVLTALLMIVLGFTVFMWLREPANQKWAIFSGGILSLAVLLRYNPFFIAPLLVFVLLFLGRKKLRSLLPGLMLFILSFALVFLPWFITARDAQGRNHYITKIQDVISSRFAPEGALPPPISTGGDPISEPEPSSGGASVLTYDLGQVDKAGISGILYHFINNELAGLAKLPTALTLHPIREQVRGGLWSFTSNQPIWRAALTTENIIALLCNLALVITGIIAAWKRFGAAGLSGLIIQTGYYAGNAVAQTSGGRYLEPVSWVVLVYYGLGIYTLTILLARVFSPGWGERGSLSQQEEVQTTYTFPGLTRGKLWGLLACCLAAGMVLPALNLVPSSLPAENDLMVESTAREKLITAGALTAEQWAAFTQQPNHVVVSGMALHPRYYRSSFFRRGNLSFEMMVLASDHVYVSYSPGIIPGEVFSDGSEVILTGCRLRRDSLWGAARIITETFAVIQLDHEGNQLIDADATWECE